MSPSPAVAAAAILFDLVQQPQDVPMQATGDADGVVAEAVDLVNVQAPPVDRPATPSHYSPRSKPGAIIEFSFDMAALLPPTADPTGQELDPAWRSRSRTSRHSIRKVPRSVPLPRLTKAPGIACTGRSPARGSPHPQPFSPQSGEKGAHGRKPPLPLKTGEGLRVSVVRGFGVRSARCI